MNKWVKDFPMLKNNVVYLDNAALVLKPKLVIDAITNYYTNISVSNRTKDSLLGILVDSTIKNTRSKIANLIDASAEEIIFTSGTTDSLNYSSLIFETLMKKDDEILLSKLNHASNIIPWIELSKKTRSKIVLTNDILNNITNKTKLICFAQTNNSFQAENNINAIYKRANEVGAFLINDAAQAIAHEKVSLKNSHAIVFSANKFYGPTGVGILAIQKEIIKKLPAKRFGGGAVAYITDDTNWENKESILMHEPGTMNIAGIFGLNAAIDYFNSLNLEETNKHINNLSNFLFDELSTINNVIIDSKRGDSILLFYIKGIEPQDVASYLGHNNIYVRSGIFCNHYLKKITNKTYIRISLSFYNTKEDIIKLCEMIKKGGDFLGFI